jgi:protein-tyrosine phosphatase
MMVRAFRTCGSHENPDAVQVFTMGSQYGFALSWHSAVCSSATMNLLLNFGNKPAIKDIMNTGIYWIPEALEGRLAIMPRPRSGEWLDDEVKDWRLAGVDVVVSLLTSSEITELGLSDEPKACGFHKITFISYPIYDREVPDSQVATQKLVKELRNAMKQSQSVAIHCRMGIGRSALIAACILTRQGLDTNLAFEAIGRARGLQVPDTDVQRAWVANFSGAGEFVSGCFTPDTNSLRRL